MESGVVANGSAEHFVQPPDALAGRDDAMFRIVRRLIDPDSPSRRFVTTTIHFVTRPRPADILRHPLLMRRGTADYPFAWLTRSFCGWYPALGQLERCARGYFKLVAEVDGTEDYRRSSEEWLSRVRRTLSSPAGMRLLLSPPGSSSLVER